MHNILNFKNKKSLILNSVLILLVVLNVVYFYLNLSNHNISNDYAFKELFINYQAGLIRRGLLGEIFLILNNVFSIEPITFFSYLFLFLYILQIYLYYKIFQKYLNSIFVILLIFLSPALILFSIYDPNIYFTKDIFVKISILVHAYILIILFNKKNDFENYLKKLKLVIIPLLTIVILVHEYQVIFLGIHYLLSLGTAKNRKNIYSISKYYLVLIIPVLFVLIFIGDQAQYQNLNLLLSKFNVEVHRQLGGGFYTAVGGFYKWHFHYFSYRDFINFFFSIILSLAIFYFSFQFLIEKKILKYNSIYQKNYIIYFLPTLLCFLLAVDHGRNISLIAVHLITFFALFSLDVRKFNLLVQNISKNFLTRVLSIIFLFFYIFMWKLDQMAGFGLRGVPNDIFQSSLFAEIVKFINFSYKFIDINIIDLPKIDLPFFSN